MIDKNDCDLDKIEDELDLRDMEEAIREHEKNPITYTLDEVRERLGLNDNKKESGNGEK